MYLHIVELVNDLLDLVLEEIANGYPTDKSNHYQNGNSFADRSSGSVVSDSV